MFDSTTPSTKCHSYAEGAIIKINGNRYKLIFVDLFLLLFLNKLKVT